mgnify:CR=1 FL=1
MEKSNNSTKNQEFGSLIRARRKDIGLTMQEVADSVGLSVGFISQIERDLTAPSLSTLVAISEVLKTPVSKFLSIPASEGMSRQVSRATYSIPGAEKSFERLSSSFPNSRINSVIVHEPPGYRSEPISHKGEEIFYILEGEITVEIEGEVTILLRGDSIHFDSNRVHSAWNHSSEVASILYCGTMDIFGDAPAPIHEVVTLGEKYKKLNTKY